MWTVLKQKPCRANLYYGTMVAILDTWTVLTSTTEPHTHTKETHSHTQTNTITKHRHNWTTHTHTQKKHTHTHTHMHHSASQVTADPPMTILQTHSQLYLIKRDQDILWWWEHPTINPNHSWSEWSYMLHHHHHTSIHPWYAATTCPAHIHYLAKETPAQEGMFDCLDHHLLLAHAII